MPPLLLAALAFSAVSSPPACRGVLAFAPPPPCPRPDAAAAIRASAASTVVSASRNDFYASSSDEDGRGSGRDWNGWDDAYFDAGLPLSPQQYQPPPFYSQQQQQPRAASSESGSSSRPFAQTNAAYSSTPPYSTLDATPPPSTWTNERQRQYRAGKFNREAAWPQKQAYRGYNRPSAAGPVGRRAAGAAAGASYDRIGGGGRGGDGGMDAPYGNRPASRLLSSNAARNNVGRPGASIVEGYNDVTSRQKGYTEDFRERSSRPSSNGPSNNARDRRTTGKEVGFGRRDSSFDVTAAATRGTGFGGDVGYLDQIREERRREREFEKDRWEERFRERGMGNVDMDDGRDTFNVLGESRRMLDDLSGPRRTSVPPPPPPPLSPPPPYQTAPPTLARRSSPQPRRGTGGGEGYNPAVRRGATSGGYRRTGPRDGDVGKTGAMRQGRGGGARRGLPPPKAQYVYETDLRPGDYGRPIDGGPGDGRGRPPQPPSLSDRAGGTLPSSREGDFGRFAGGAGYRYYDDGKRTQPPAKQRSAMSSTTGPDGFGRDASGAGYRYYDNPSSMAKPRGPTKGGNGVGDRREENRYARPRPPSPLEGNTYSEDFEDADDYSLRTRGAAPDGGPPFEEKRDRFEGRSAQERADGAFDRRRRLSQTSFGGASTGLDTTLEPTVGQSSFGQRPPPPPPSTFGGGRDDVMERLSSRQRADRSFDRPGTMSQQSFGQRPQSTFGGSVSDLGDSASSQQRADRSFDRRRSMSQQSFGDARDDDVALDRRMPAERTDDRPYESKLLSKVQQYPPARRSSGTGASPRDNSKPQPDFGLDGIKKMVDKILSPYAEDGGAFAVDRMMGRVNSDIDRSILDEKRWIKSLLADARGFLLADAVVRDMLGGAITLGKPLSKSASSTMVGDVTKARLQLVIPITGSEGEGRIRLEANQDEIERLELEAEGRVIDVRLDGPGGPGDVLDADVYTFPNSGE